MQMQGDNMTFQIPGSVISAAEQAKAAANAALEAATPTYNDMLNTIKSGSIFKDVSQDLGALGNLGVDTSAISEQISKARSTMAIDMAVANAAVAQKVKEAQAAGTTVSEAAMEAAMAPLAVLKNLKNSLSNVMNSAASAASSAASVLGAALPEGIGGSLPSPADIINSTKSAINSFTATVPPETIIDSETGQTITNPAYTAFTAIPGNLDKLSSIGGLTSQTSSLAGGLASSLSSFAAAAEAGKADILGTLKADAMLANLTKPMPAGLGAIASDSLNLSNINPYNAIKAQEVTPKIVVEKTPDPVRPQSNSAILKGISPSKITDDVNRRIWAHELKGLATDRDAKGEAFWKSMGSSLKAPEGERDIAKNAWFASLFTPEQEAIRQQSIAIKNAKPDSKDWTPEEAAIRAQSKANAAKAYETENFIRVDTLREEYNKYIDWYDLAYKTWIDSGSRFSLPADLLTVMGTYNP